MIRSSANEKDIDQLYQDRLDYFKHFEGQQTIIFSGQLWKIEKVFRVSKHNLKIRQIYHRLQQRIEAHNTINFVANKIYKEFERQLKEKQAKFGCEQIIDIAKTIYRVEIINLSTGEVFKEVLLLNDEQIQLAKLFDF